MPSRFRLVVALALTAPLIPASAQADQVTLIAPGGIRSAIEQLIPAFERLTGHSVKATFGSGGGTKQQVIQGEVFDVPIVQPPLNPVFQSGHVVVSSVTPLASVAVAVAVRKGQPKPDISTADAVRRMLRAATSISYPDGSTGAAAGVSFDATLKTLGIADEMQPKIRRAAGGAGAMALLAKGDVDLGVTFQSEMSDPGIDIVGPLPAGISTPTSLVGFVSAQAKAPTAARALLKFLTSEDAAGVYTRVGMVPAVGTSPATSPAQSQPGGRGNQAPGPTVTVQGHTFTQQSLFQRNIGGPDDMTTAFPPHKIIGNIYYVGTRSLAAFLIVTPQGNILVNSTYERNVPIIQKSIEQLGFKFSDTKILLGSHAHGDHQEGDALVKQLTGAQVMAMAEDVPALEAMKPGGKAHPIDRVLHDGDSVSLGGTTLVAHLTAGHSRGCTTWTLKADEGGRSYDVVIIGSLGTNPGFKLVNNTETPKIADEFVHAFKVSRELPCDVPLGSHPGMYNLAEKYAKLQQGGPNPFIDPAGYKLEVDIDEAMFRAVLAEQQQAAKQ